MISVHESAAGATFAVRIHPRARRNAITGILGEGEAAAIKVALCAPPIDGRANEAVMEFFSDLFGVPRYAVSILSGAQSRNKVLRIAGRSAAEIVEAIAPNIPPVPA